MAIAPPVVRGPLLVGKSDEARRAERNDGTLRSTTYPSLPSVWRPISAPIPVVGALVPFVRDPLGFVQACADGPYLGGGEGGCVIIDTWMHRLSGLTN